MPFFGKFFRFLPKRGSPSQNCWTDSWGSPTVLIQSKNKHHFWWPVFDNKNFSLVTFFKILNFAIFFAVFCVFRGLNGLKLKNCSNKLWLTWSFLLGVKISCWYLNWYGFYRVGKGQNLVTFYWFYWFS